jgi:hypothetical protein
MVPAVAFAQASITGLVRDTSGAVLPVVTVEASSPVLIEKVRSVISDDTGRYRIEDLRPGVYTVTFTLAGFAALKREGIELMGNFVATVNADLRVGALEETVTVTGEAPTVDVQSTLRQTVMNRQILDSIPFGRSDRDLSILIPGTSTDRVDVGGSATTVTGRALIHGSRGSSQRLLQSGLSIAVPFDGSGSSQQANLAAYQEVTVDTASVDATQDAGGVRVNLVPKDGGNTFRDGPGELRQRGDAERQLHSGTEGPRPANSRHHSTNLRLQPGVRRSHQERQGLVLHRRPVQRIVAVPRRNLLQRQRRQSKRLHLCS